MTIISQVHFAYAQTASILPPAKTTFFDSNGNPLTSGTVESYIPSTTTHKTTWQDAAETIPNLNPLTLDAAGRTLLLGSGSYRQVVKDRDGNLIWDQVTSSTGSGSGGGSTATGDGDLVGTIKPWAGISAPNQYMFTYGQTLNRITFSALFNAITSTQAVFCTSGNPTLTGLSDTTNFWIGMSVETSCVPAGFTTIISKTSSSVTLAVNANTTVNTSIIFFPWGNGNHSTTFTLPDFRGLIPVGNNIMGGVASSNINDTYFGSQSASSAGGQGGSSSATLLLGNLPNSALVISDTRVWRTLANNGAGNNGTGLVNTNTSASGTNYNAVSQNSGGGINLPIEIGSGSISGTLGGSSTAFGIIQPSKTINYIIKVTPDANSATASGVTDLNGMTGSVACGQGLTCTGNTIAVTIVGGVTSLGGQTGVLTCGVGITCSGSSISATVSSVFTRTGAIVAASGDYNAGQITYTPVGTGGVATTDKAILDRTVWANDYGAACNGAGNDATAFQNAINQGQTAGLSVRWTGVCLINSGLSITTSIDFGGPGNGGAFGIQPRLVVTSASVLGITITTNSTAPVYLHDFGVTYSPAANAGVAAITVTGTAANENSGSKFERLTLNGGIAIGIDFVKASLWTLSNSQIVSSNSGGTAIRVANGNNGDSGDSTIYSSTIQQTGGAGIGIAWNSSGGLRIENNKILGSTMANGISINLANGVNTSDIFIVGNSIEGLTTSGIGVNLTRAGTTGGLNHVIIGHNELGGGQVCVSVPTDVNGTWINNINITGNSCQVVNSSSAVGFNIVAVIGGAVVMNNSVWATGAGTNQVAIMGAFGTAANCVEGYNTKIGTFAPSTNSGTCTTVAPF